MQFDGFERPMPMGRIRLLAEDGGPDVASELLKVTLNRHGLVVSEDEDLGVTFAFVLAAGLLSELFFSGLRNGGIVDSIDVEGHS